MRYILVDLENPQKLTEEFDRIVEFVKNHDFLIIYLFESDILLKQRIDALMKLKYQSCELLDMRVITCNVCGKEVVMEVFASVKANRSIFQSAKTIEDIESLLRLQVTNKNDKFMNIGRCC